MEVNEAGLKGKVGGALLLGLLLQTHTHTHTHGGGGCVRLQTFLDL